ncbi:serine protease [Actinomadura craniellae]|uniref:Serine protease n=1 Tax=Actinomadura craniellae TaxID=2231787 RepID=A0A365H804_9ACTN|nr:trypsin-like peptidase domain-containing protein [Actinomadura craniellae]RAY15250.1 serine protease [Actinomadura craniellae]
MRAEDQLPKEFVELANIQYREQEKLLARQRVVGVALGYKHTSGESTGKKAVTVLVDVKMPKDALTSEERIPAKIGDAITDVQEVGVLQAGAPLTTTGAGQLVAPPTFQGVSQLPQGPLVTSGDLGMTVVQNGAVHAVRVDDRSLPALEHVGPFRLTKRIRPAHGGVSVGHVNITAGTLGTCVYDAAASPGIPQRYYMLSNNHVLANSNNASIGDPILQPGPADGGTFPGDVVARLSRFVPIRFIQSGQPVPLNLVDAAVAEGDFEDLDRRVYWVGNLKGLNTTPAVGLTLQKCGRTTNYTTGTVMNINATVDVNYGGGRVARFTGQIQAGNMSAPGDSGSIVADLDERAVGLLFAGSPAATIINPIVPVQELLGIKVAE